MQDKCWIYAGRISSHGYAMVGAQYGHRIMWEYIHQYEIPKGLQIDHLCRNRACINPEHLELVSPRVNYLRGEGISAQWARRATCKYGHLYEAVERTDRKRVCRICERKWAADYAKRKKNTVDTDGGAQH